jgi:hypothetical protein
MKPRKLVTTGISGHFGKILLPLLEEDDEFNK